MNRTAAAALLLLASGLAHASHAASAHGTPAHGAVASDAGATASAPASPGATATSTATAFAALSTASMATRVYTLAQLGLRDTVLGGAAATRREFYLPVPPGIAISDAALQMDASYLRADGGRTTELLSIDGTPVAGRSVLQAQGDASAALGVDGRARDAGFVRFGVAWTSVINDNVCADQTADGNVLTIAPTSRLSYRFDSAAVTDLRTAWNALPAAPVVMVAGKALDPVAYDAAWRTDALLQRDGRTPLMRALPAVGDTVALGNVSVPAALRALPAFAALASGGTHRLNDAAEVAALVGLANAAGFAPDVMIANDAMRHALDAAADALRAQVAAAMPGSLGSYDAWRQRFIAPLSAPLAAGEVRLVHLGAQDIVVLGDPLGLSVLAQTWRPVDVSDRLVVHQLDTVVQADTDAIALSDLGGVPRTLDVYDQATWEASFDLGAASGHNRVPDNVVLDLAAAPSPMDGAPIASIYFNDVLIGASRIAIDGRAQRVTARIPHYALAARNTVRVLLQRHPDALGCTARGRGYPVAILPTSHLTLEQAGPEFDNDFTGMNIRLASHAALLLPQAYLDDALDSAPRVAGLVNAAGMSPVRAVLTVVAGDGRAKPDGPFVAADVKLDDAQGRVQVSDDKLKLSDASGRVLFDVSGLSNLAVIDIVRSGSYPGVMYRSIGQRAAAPPPGFVNAGTAALQLSRGDIAVIHGNEIVKQIDTLHPDGVYGMGAGGSLRNILRWAIPAALVVGFLLLLLLALLVRHKRRNTPR